MLLAILTITISLHLPFAQSSTSFGYYITKPDCLNYCGNIAIPYPFGLTSSCSTSPTFVVNCDETFDPPKAFIGDENIEILSITETRILGRNRVAWNCYYPRKTSTFFDIDLSNTPLSFSTLNKLTVVGCDDVALLSGDGVGPEWSWSDNYVSSCVGICADPGDLTTGLCEGIGCCEASIPEGLVSINMNMLSLSGHEKVSNFSFCGYAFIGEENVYSFKVSDIWDSANLVSGIVENVPMVFDWRIGNKNCDEIGDNICQANSVCDDSGLSDGYLCSCSPGFHGNPYLAPGCQDIDECENDPCHETALCFNYEGSFNCSCPSNHRGNASRNSTGCFYVVPLKQIVLFAGLPMGFGLFVLVLLAFWLYKVVKKRRVRKTKDAFFERNGGLLLKQQMSANVGFLDSMRIFKSKELERATDRFNESRMLGFGGQGSVYKGMLSDGRIIAVKKSKQVNQNSLEEFINEVVILSLINHRNVVKLLGCCLETEIPLLVYEFVPNGTLYHLILDQDNGFPLSWDLRLRIATEIANALAYLHYATSLPIYHRDMKSSNILLDEKYRAKLSDFGISRSIAIDQTHLTTDVKGTFGYLDPEYFQTGKFTEKSDVYSFGVVLVELLTGRKLVEKNEEEGSLVTQFLLAMEEKEILDGRIIEQGVKEEHVVVCNLARRCLNLNGKKRPTIREVGMELERIKKCDNSSSFESNIQEMRLDNIESFMCLDLDAYSQSLSSNSNHY